MFEFQAIIVTWRNKCIKFWWQQPNASYREDSNHNFILIHFLGLFLFHVTEWMLWQNWNSHDSLISALLKRTQSRIKFQVKTEVGWMTEGGNDINKPEWKFKLENKEIEKRWWLLPQWPAGLYIMVFTFINKQGWVFGHFSSFRCRNYQAAKTSWKSHWNKTYRSRSQNKRGFVFQDFLYITITESLLLSMHLFVSHYIS